MENLTQMALTQVDGLMRSTISSLRPYNYSERTGTKFTNMWEHEVVLRPDLMLKSTSISFKRRGLRKLNRNSLF
jgi:hypothetical protein